MVLQQVYLLPDDVGKSGAWYLTDEQYAVLLNKSREHVLVRVDAKVLSDYPYKGQSKNELVSKEVRGPFATSEEAERLLRDPRSLMGGAHIETLYLSPNLSEGSFTDVQRPNYRYSFKGH